MGLFKHESTCSHKLTDLGGNGHREYDIDLRLLFPFMRLPSMRSLYTLTAYIFWPNWPKSPIDFAPLKHTSNITTLYYDESVLAPVNVISSLCMFKGLKSFRWTASQTCFALSIDFIGVQKALGAALLAHKDTLEELHVDIRHVDRTGEARQRSSDDAILIGSLKSYTKLRRLTIDANSICGHQNWRLPGLALVDMLPPNLESLTLFVKLSILNTDGSKVVTFDNKVWVSSLSQLIQNAPPALRKVSLQITQDPPAWLGEGVEPDITFLRDVIEDIKRECAKAHIAFDHQMAVQVFIDGKRTAGYTDIPYFLGQIKGRNPGRDF